MPKYHQNSLVNHTPFNDTGIVYEVGLQVLTYVSSLILPRYIYRDRIWIHAISLVNYTASVIVRTYFDPLFSTVGHDILSEKTLARAINIFKPHLSED